MYPLNRGTWSLFFGRWRVQGSSFWGVVWLAGSDSDQDPKSGTVVEGSIKVNALRVQELGLQSIGLRA